jgi:lipooligosaccharide transport system permease protein
VTTVALEPARRVRHGPRSMRLVERSVAAYRRNWPLLVSGAVEPVFYLLGIGYGVGGLVGSVAGPNGHPLPYAVFVAPALMATSAMNGAIFDSTFNLFFKLKITKIYDAMLSTPLEPSDIAVGEVTWALLRGTVYATGFIVIMAALHLLLSPWALLAIPAAMLIGLAFAAVGCALTTFMRWWTDFDKINMAILPLFLFSGTFFPVTLYPGPLRWVVEASPLYRGVHLLRGLTTGDVTPVLAIDVLYLGVLGVVGVAVLRRRLRKLLLP